VGWKTGKNISGKEGNSNEGGKLWINEENGWVFDQPQSRSQKVEKPNSPKVSGLGKLRVLVIFVMGN
jgi:hypothetical protein